MFLLAINVLIVYYLSSYSIYYFNPSLKVLLKIFFFPFFFLPSSLYISCGGGFFTLCLPNPLTIALAFIISNLFMVIFVRCLSIIYKRFRLKFVSKFAFPLTLFLVVIILFIFTLIDKQYCIYRFQQGDDGSFYSRFEHSKFATGGGVIAFSFPVKSIGVNGSESSITPEQRDIFYKVNNLEYLTGDTNSLIYVRVPPGQEFARACYLRSYRQIDTVKIPRISDLLETPSIMGHYINFWIYMDKNFCKTNQIDFNTCVKRYKSINSTATLDQ